MGDSMFVLHCDFPGHVRKRSVSPFIVGPLEIKEVAKGFIRRKLSAGGDQAAGPPVQRALEFGKEPFPGGVGTKSRDKISVVHEAKPH